MFLTPSNPGSLEVYMTTTPDTPAHTPPATSRTRIYKYDASTQLGSWDDAMLPVCKKTPQTISNTTQKFTRPGGVFGGFTEQLRANVGLPLRQFLTSVGLFGQALDRIPASSRKAFEELKCQSSHYGPETFKSSFTPDELDEIINAPPHWKPLFDDLGITPNLETAWNETRPRMTPQEAEIERLRKLTRELEACVANTPLLQHTRRVQLELQENHTTPVPPTRPATVLHTTEPPLNVSDDDEDDDRSDDEERTTSDHEFIDDSDDHSQDRRKDRRRRRKQKEREQEARIARLEQLLSDSRTAMQSPSVRRTLPVTEPVSVSPVLDDITQLQPPSMLPATEPVSVSPFVDDVRLPHPSSSTHLATSELALAPEATSSKPPPVKRARDEAKAAAAQVKRQATLANKAAEAAIARSGLATPPVSDESSVAQSDVN